jgi:transcriptional regulator GlxA family with amidase domain
MTIVPSIISEQTNVVHPALPQRPDLKSRSATFSAPLAAGGIADGTRPSASVARSRGGLLPGAIRRVRQYIETHLDEKLSLQTLAGVAGVSKFHFGRAFKQSEGVTPHDYLIQCRVRRTKELLAGTDLPISEVAVSAGFFDQSHCVRRFRERVGVCPRVYRRLAR